MEKKYQIQYTLQITLSDYEFGFKEEDDAYFYYLADTEWGDHLYRVNKDTLEVHWKYNDGSKEDDWEFSESLNLNHTF